MVGLQNNIFIGVGVTWAAAFVSLALRIVARRITKVAWWFDDYFCVAAFVFASGYSSIMLEWTIHWSLGQYIPDSIEEATRDHILEKSRLLAFFNSLTYAFSIASSKICILSFYWRIFRLSSIRKPILVMIVICAMWIILRTFMVIFRCIPVQTYWDHTIPDANCRIKDGFFYFGTVLTHFVMDVIILCLPVFEVFKLHLRLGQKCAIAGLFIIGAVVCVASVFVLIESIHYDPKTDQMPYAYAMNCLWATVEVNVAIVSACFPLLQPIFRLILPARVLSSPDSYPTNQPSHIINLTTLTRTKKDKENDESSSTYQLADPESGLSYMADDEMSNIQASECIRTVVSSQYHEYRRTEYHEMTGIRV